MSSTEPGASAPDAAGDVRSLPPRPSLEFERNQAKKLLSLLRKGDPDSVNRVRRVVKRTESHGPEDFQLADAQFTIAREYGFLSWPRLVEYFETLARHEASGAREQGHGREAHEMWARGHLSRHRNRRTDAAQLFAAFVPRFYGRSSEEIFAAAVTEDEARLVQARMNRYPSWEVMISEDHLPDEWERHTSPRTQVQREALQAIRSEDANRLAEILAAHPYLRTDSVAGQPGDIELVRMVFLHDLRTEAAGTSQRIEWLRNQMDIQSTLNWLQLGFWHWPTSSLRILLQAGADPSWLPPNGISVLEHALVRWWNGEAVDLLAARVKPPESFWVAAGLGDVSSVKRFVDAAGRPTEAARKSRPDFMAMSIGFLPLNPAADDQTILWEGWLVAALNQRFEVLDVMLDRGFPIDYSAWGQTILHLAVGNGWVPLLEYLASRGANLDLVRDMAEARFLNPHGHPQKQRILELCGGRSPEVLVREREEQRARRLMQTHHMVEEAFVFAKQDAIRQGRTAVSPENLLVAILSQGRIPLTILHAAGVDLNRLHAHLAERFVTPAEPPAASMSSDPDATAVLLAAKAEAERRKHDAINTLHVFVALLSTAAPVVSALLGPFGGESGRLRAEVDRMLASS